MPTKCPRCTAECTCKKVKRKAKPRYGRLARSKPVATPPMPQQFIFNPLPAMRERQEMATLKEIPSVPSLQVDTAVAEQRKADKEREREMREREKMEVEDLRSNIPRAFERGLERGQEYTLSLSVPFGKSTRGTLREVIENTAEGKKMGVAFRPTGYIKAQKTSELMESMAKEMESMAGGGAVGGGVPIAETDPTNLRRRPKVAPQKTE